MADVRILLQR